MYVCMYYYVSKKCRHILEQHLCLSTFSYLTTKSPLHDI